MFPTPVRNLANAHINVCGRIGNVLGPLVFNMVRKGFRANSLPKISNSRKILVSIERAENSEQAYSNRILKSLNFLILNTQQFQAIPLMGAPYLIMTILCFMNIVLFIVFIPETKGKSLHEKK